MSREIEGVVESELPRGLYAVRSSDGRRWTASLPVETRRVVVRLVRGDRVLLEPSDTDSSRGRIRAKL